MHTLTNTILHHNLLMSSTCLNISFTTNECYGDLQVAILACFMYWRDSPLFPKPIFSPIQLVIGVGPLSQERPHFSGITISNSLPQIYSQLLLSTA